MQSLKTLFLYTQGKKEMVEEYARNLRSQWDTLEAFGRLPGVHKGLVEGLIRTPRQVADPHKGGSQSEQGHKGGFDDQQRGQEALHKFKGQFANSYLLGSDQYPDTFDKATRIPGNYQTTSRLALPYKPSSNDMGVAFLQRGG